MKQSEMNVVWIETLAVDELPVNTGKTVRCGVVELALFRLASGEVHAIANRCPHKSGVLAEGIVAGGHVFCPMHDRKINLASGEMQKPDTGCVATYKTKVEHGRIYILLPRSAAMAV